MTEQARGERNEMERQSAYGKNLEAVVRQAQSLPAAARRYVIAASDTKKSRDLGQAGEAQAERGNWDRDFPPVGTVRYELHTEMGGDRRCIKRVEVVAICESREAARQWMLDRR